MWLTPVLILGIFFLLGVGIDRNLTVLQPGDLWLPVLAGLLLGWGMAGMSNPGIPAITAGLLVGPGLVFIQVGNLAPKITAVISALLAVARQGLSSEQTANWSMASVEWQELTSAIGALITRLTQWLAGFFSNEPVVDPVVTALLWLFILGATSMWAGWAVRRWKRPILALLPGQALLAIILVSTGGSALELAPVLALTLYMEATTAQLQNESGWIANKIDYPSLSASTTRWVASGLALGLMILASITPSFSVHRLVEYVQDLGQGQQGQDLTRSLGLETQPVSPERDAFLKQRRPGLPAGHLIGSGPELGDKPVMAITIEEPPSLAGRLQYWRGATYDRYTGQGWQTRGTTTIRYEAGEQASRELEHQWLIRQDVKLLDDLDSLVYVAGTLATVDQPYQSAWRARFQGTDTYTDLFAVGIIGDPPDEYRADSLLSLPGEEELRAAGQLYPARITRNYLALPEGLSDRVRALALDLTATEVTPYDRALAIERYLRQIPYSLDLPAPPIGREITDYFLFELQQGYCDYYATAMAVLARAAGVPARLATGYIGGVYDRDNRRYTITADLAHSWPEIYFPGYGWIPFEPTAGRAAIDRQTQQPNQSEPVLGKELEPILAARQRARWQTILRITIIGFLLLSVTVAAWWLTGLWRLKILEPEAAIVAIFSQMRRSSRMLDLGEKPGATPHEYTRLLKEHLLTAEDIDVGGGLWAGTAENIDWLAKLYTRSMYSPYQPGIEQRTQAIRGWSRLRIRILWAVIASAGKKQLTRFRSSR